MTITMILVYIALVLIAVGIMLQFIAAKKEASQACTKKIEVARTIVLVVGMIALIIVAIVGG